MTTLLALYALLLGAVVGSFLNVVVHRYPLGESIVFPASRCPHCSARIRPWDNIPVASWLLLRGRCRDCGVGIALRYPLLEAANALFYLAILLRTGPSLAFFPLAAIVSMTLVLIFIDLDIQILPDVIDIPGIAIGIAMGAFALGDRGWDLVLSTRWVDSLLGALLGGGILLAVALAYKLVRKIEGMGLGDVKMLAMIGAVVGWQAVLPTLFLASITGALFGIGMAVRRRENLQFALPFGVFLGIAALVVLFFGRSIFTWYLSLLVP